MGKPIAIILAAGQGTRMRTELPKVLNPICGLEMVLWPVRAAQASDAAKVIVVDSPGKKLEPVLPDGVEIAVQPKPDGTGGAVRAAAELIDRDAPVLVLSGDVPLFGAEEIKDLLETHQSTQATATVATMFLDDPAAYGRIVRDESGVTKIVETKEAGDATEEELKIREVNAGIYVFNGAALLDSLASLAADNAQSEYYLPDALLSIRANGGRVVGHILEDPIVAMGINGQADLAEVRVHAQERIARRHMEAGVTIVSPLTTTIDVDVEIGTDTVIEPSTFLHGSTSIGRKCSVGPATTIKDSQLADGVNVLHSVLDSARVADDVKIGPFAYLRPDADLAAGSKAGTFVEIKNSIIGPGAKVPHLSYIGDADVGEGSNLGAGTITANYDGKNKHRTKIGARVRGGVDTSFVAPVTVGDDAYTAAGSVITEDIPDGSLGVARERQKNIDGYSARNR